MTRRAIRFARRAAEAVTVVLAVVVYTAFSTAAGPPEDAAPLDIGFYFSAGDARSAEARELEQGASLALDLDAAAGKTSGRAARPIVAPKGGRWEAGAGELVRIVWSEGVQAVLGPVDGRSAHLAEQVVARAKGRFVLLVPWAGDPGLTRIKVPWFFRLAHDDLRQAHALLEEIHGARRLRSVLVFAAASDHDSRTAAEALRRAAAEGGMPEPRNVPLGENASGLDRAAAEARASGAEAVIILAPPADAARAARRLRAEGVVAPFFGPLGLAAPAFLDAAGAAAEGMVLAAPPEPSGAPAERFRDAYRKTHGREPGTPAGYGYDGAVVLLDALRASRGAGGEPLRKALALARQDGLTGKIEFDASGSRAGPSPLARVEQGRLLAIRGAH